MASKRFPRLTGIRLLLLVACLAAMALVNYLIGGWLGPGLAVALGMSLASSLGIRWRREDEATQKN